MTPEHIILLHGRGGKPTGSVLQLEECLRPHFPGSQFMRPALLHGDPDVTAQASLAALRKMPIPRHSVLIGISLGGLVAASLQEESRDDLKVICISSPTWSGEVRLARQVPNRTSLYSSRDTVIAGRVEQWPQLARSFDLPWLSHDTDKHKLALSRLIVASLKGEDVRAVVEALPQSDEYRLKDIRPPGWMRGARRRVAAWMRRP